MESKDKIKVGDKVRVIARTNGHEFLIGQTIVINRIYQGDDYRCLSEDGKEVWHLQPDEFELIPPDLISKSRVIEELEGMIGKENSMMDNLKLCEAIERIKNPK